MTPRERFLATMTWGVPDRIPYRFGGPRESTFNAWYKQGLPRDLNFGRFIGYDHWEQLPVDLGPLPRFEEVVLEETNRHKIWIDYLGAKRIDHKVLPTPGFVTRSWLEFPVKNREDWLEMRPRYQAETAGRTPEDWGQRVERYRNRDFVLGLTIQSMFWRVRDWVGFEGLCMMFHEDPTLVHEMMDHVVDLTIAVLDEPLREVEVDFVFFNEDMAYKTASMISPVEIAANNDPVAYRKQYGKDLLMMGGIDKRELRFDKERVRREVLAKVPWLVEQGGYIPGVDHGVPPDVPVRNFLYMCELIKEIACGGTPDLWEPTGELEAHLGPIEEMWTPDMALPPDDEEG